MGQPLAIFIMWAKPDRHVLLTTHYLLFTDMPLKVIYLSQEECKLMNFSQALTLERASKSERLHSNQLNYMHVYITYS